MIEDVVEGVFRVLGRFFGRIFIEIIFELLIKGPGYVIVKIFTKKSPDPDGTWVAVSGIIFWVIVGFGIYFIKTNIGEEAHA